MSEKKHPKYLLQVILEVAKVQLHMSLAKEQGIKYIQLEVAKGKLPKIMECQHLN